MSEPLGFPPIAAPSQPRDRGAVAEVRTALLRMSDDPRGREILGALRLDGFVAARPVLFDGIAGLLQVAERIE